jgi:hypothetical protein
MCQADHDDDGNENEAKKIVPMKEVKLYQRNWYNVSAENP